MRFALIVFSGMLLQSFVVDRFSVTAIFDRVQFNKMVQILMSERALNDSPTCTLLVTYLLYYIKTLFIYFIIFNTTVVTLVIKSVVSCHTSQIDKHAKHASF
ncbi:Uncharacterized protein FWK35_00025720 [Aphis craccivora]|uniref:Uncharacterized protein n=1 Tax=Aphis craccivora TaxID=307492 RepID=A0A6G0YJ68_APHCR|nr:Uncharacterized protein FWK35_00025720 [Aphis craccivora]